MTSLFFELRRRNVIRVTLAYIVMSWVLVQVLELATDAFAAPDWALKLVITLLVLGLVPTVVFSWVYELTPEGVKRESEIGARESITHHTARRLDWVVVALLVAAIGLFIADRMLLDQGLTTPATPAAVTAAGTAESLQPAADSQANSVAVLPFVDLSPGGDQGYFSDGIAEEILNVLVRVDGLSVASRTSSFQFKGRDLGIPEIAESLDVRHILEGSVRKAGDTLRITAQLIDTANDRHLWSETYDRALTAENIFDIQDDIASAIVQALSSAMGMEAETLVKVPIATDNLSAYELYLQAKPLFQSRTRLLEANELLIRAVELDPEFVEAMELRAGVLTVLYEYESSTDASENIEIAMALVERILTLSPDSAIAYAARGNVNWDSAVYHEGDLAHWESNLADLNRAITLDPKSTEALNWSGLAWNTLGFVEKALENFLRCHQIDPLYRPCAENRQVMLANLGRDDEAMAALKADLGKGVSNTIWTPLSLLAREGQELLFLAILSTPDVLLGYPRIAEVYAAYRAGRIDKELASDAIRFSSAKGQLSEAGLALLFQPVGGYDLRPMMLYVWDAAYANYRRSPQFNAYMHRIGVVEYWHAHGFPPQCRAAGTDDFVCD